MLKNLRGLIVLVALLGGCATSSTLPPLGPPPGTGVPPATWIEQAPKAPRLAAFPNFPGTSGGGGGGVTSAAAGTGISVSASTGAVTFGNTGVTAAVAGTGVAVSAGTGAVTFSNTGVTSALGSTCISVSSSTGAVTFTDNCPFAASTNIDALNGSSNLKHILNVAASYVSNTDGAEVTKWVVTLLNAGSQVTALDIRPTQLLAASGVVGNPGYAFQQSLTSGMWWDGTNTLLKFSVGGTLAASMSATVMNIGGVIQVGSEGSATTPSVRISATEATGAYRPFAQTYGIAVNGSASWWFTNTGVFSEVAGQIYSLDTSVGAYGMKLLNSSTNTGLISAHDIQMGGNTSDLATSATAGFLEIGAMSGAPTGSVTAAGGHVLLVVDKTNKKICYEVSGGTWECSAAFTP